MTKHVVLIGFNYQQKRSTGDKNFWSDLVPLLAMGLNRISILSIRKHPHKQKERVVNSCRILIKYLSPRFLETPDANYSRPKIFWRKGAFPRLLGVIEKQMNIRRVTTELQSIYKDCPFSHIHLMDNFGPGNKLISNAGRYLNATTSVSAIAYQGKNPLLYHPYLRISYNDPNLYIVSYSLTFKEKLLEIGFSQDRIRHIPWGVLISNNDFLSEDKKFTKKALGLPDDRPLFLWAGYIQQVQRKDFLFAIQQTRNAIKKGLKATFYFAFKPEAIEKGFETFHKPEQGIHVTSTNLELFDRLKFSADFFYSPVVNKRCIVPPPLTWIEMVSNGVPILSTNVPGASEIVEDGKTGYLARDDNELIDRMFLLKKTGLTMKISCRIKIKNEYNIQNSCRKYLDLFGQEKIDDI
jgi:glycosyltransferase involved in cell wall biosynthesis